MFSSVLACTRMSPAGKLLEVAVECATGAGFLLLDTYFRSDALVVDSKGDADDLITGADLASHRFIVSKIRSRRPRGRGHQRGRCRLGCRRRHRLDRRSSRWHHELRIRGAALGGVGGRAGCSGRHDLLSGFRPMPRRTLHGVGGTGDAPERTSGGRPSRVPDQQRTRDHWLRPRTHIADLPSEGRRRAGVAVSRPSADEQPSSRSRVGRGWSQRCLRGAFARPLGRRAWEPPRRAGGRSHGFPALRGSRGCHRRHRRQPSRRDPHRSPVVLTARATRRGLGRPCPPSVTGQLVRKQTRPYPQSGRVATPARCQVVEDVVIRARLCAFSTSAAWTA